MLDISAVQSLLFIAIVIVVCYVRRWRFERRYKLPPGPFCWPVVGYLPFPTLKRCKLLTQLARKHGGLFGMYVGNRYVVVLDDWQAVKDSFNKESFYDRPAYSTQISEVQPSLIDMNGPGWKEQRKFQINSFRLLGAFTKEFEDFIRHNATDAVKQLQNKIGQVVNTQHAVEFALNNVTFRLLYGKSFEPNHPLIRLLTDYDNAVVYIWGLQTLTVFMPWLLDLIEWTRKMRRARKCIAEMDQVVLDEIKDHQASLNPDEPRDYIDKYLIEMNSSDAHPSYTMENLIGNVKVLLEASSETTNVSLNWFLLSMAEYQDIQDNVFHEIESVLGLEMQPQYSDRHRLPYTLATLQESMRWKNLLHLNVYRECSEDTVVCGYDVPKGSVVIQNMTSHFHNDKYWPDPEKFDPQRFLSKDGKTVQTPEFFIPFSYGGRMCPGDKLAKINLFIFVVSLIQKLHICPPKGGVRFEENPIYNNHPIYPYVKLEKRA